MADTKVHTRLTAVTEPLGSRWRKETLSRLTDVEELLDWLENAGCAEWHLAVTDDAFVVRWR